MSVLVPSWALHYEEFWLAIRTRNLWFIKLRYFAVLMLLVFIFGSELILDFSFTTLQLKAILLITSSILIYNLLLHYIRQFVISDADKFNPLHLSLIQMMLDLTALWLLVYYTGGIETPLYLLFIFHMIIGSLILPGWIIYIIAAWFVLGFTGLVILEYAGTITHHSINGFLKTPLYNNADYVFAFSTIFTFVIFISVMLANRIAKQLYKMEQNLVETLDKLESTEKEKQKYIIGVLHEIKTPLAALHSYFDIILDKYLGPIDSKVEEKLIRAKVRSEEAMELVNDVLRISRVKLINEFKKESVDINAVINEIMKKEAFLIKSRNLKIQYNDTREEEINLSGDRFWLEIAFSNLINNAVKYTCDNGNVEINVSDNEKWIEIEISDNGIGIPEKELEKIFNEFYRATNIRQIKFEGSGLGLAIVKQIIERHSGTIEVLSPSRVAAEGKPGSTFIVKLPYANI
ncbi:MAG: HAMP domain-containing sensor histidine kinase [Ignavibacteriaceae bacterium]